MGKFRSEAKVTGLAAATPAGVAGRRRAPDTLAGASVRIRAEARGTTVYASAMCPSRRNRYGQRWW